MSIGGRFVRGFGSGVNVFWIGLRVRLGSGLGSWRFVRGLVVRVA